MSTEAGVVEDQYDPLLLRLVEAEPPGDPPLRALRRVMKAAFAQIPPDEIAKVYQRTELMLQVPALRMRMLDSFTSSLDLFAGLVADRTGRQAGEVEVRAFAGAVTGVMISSLFIWADGGGTENLGELIDRALAHLESGLVL